ncbi:MAG: hypothetical protein LBK58_10180, partial [Prevotellaceae bacterium]|nr:hypothetical protein [Prevotellaceae bacterium]
MKLKEIILLTCLLLPCLPVAAQDNLLSSGYSYRRYTTQDGLPCMIMQCIFKDNRGFLWQGTFKGASRFDGFDFEPYASDMFSHFDRIEEVNGEIRFFCDGEMQYSETGKHIILSDSMYMHPHNSYLLPANHYIYQNRNGKKYFVRLENDSISEIIDIPQLQGLYNCKVYLDQPHNQLYIPCYREKRVYIHDLGTNSTQVIENVVLESFLKHSRLGLLGIGNDGIYRISNGKAEMYVPLKFEMQNKTAVETRFGDVYVKDFNNIYRISGTKVEHLYHNFAITIWDMVLDNDENLWVATSQGLYNFFHFDFKEYQIRKHTVRGISQDDAGTYWIAGDYEDIFSLSGEDFKQVKYPYQTNSSSVSFIRVFSHRGRTYFLIRGGILIHENGRFHWAEASRENDWYQNIAAYGDNLLVAVVNTDKIVEITPEGKHVRTCTGEELQQSGFMGVAADRHRRILAGGEDGISIVEDSCVSLLKNRNTEDSDIVCVDARDHIFSAARKHLNLVKGDSVITVHSFDNDYIMGLLPFDMDNMIVATLKGIYIFNSAKYFETGEVQMLFYNQNNGMNGIEPKYSAMFLDKKGLVWMVTSDRIVSFDPQKLLRQVSAPSLLVRNTAVSRDNVEWKEFADIAGARFSHSNRNFRFSFIGLCYSSVENVRYRYRLTGFQNDWSEPSRNREATFNNLRPGSYVFEVYADSGTDGSRSAVQSIPFTIRPAFWQTWWFYLACTVMLALIAGFLAYSYLDRKNRRKITALERQKQLNSLQIQSIRLRSIPHFNANVLAGIEYYIMN